MSDLRKAAQKVLEAWDTRAGIDEASNSFEELRIALAKQESSEPIAWIHREHYLLGYMPPADKLLAQGWEPLYTALPAREWQGLTEEEIWACNQAQTDEEFCHICVDHQHVPDFARAIEAKLKEKNT